MKDLTWSGEVRGAGRGEDGQRVSNKEKGFDKVRGTWPMCSVGSQQVLFGTA